MINIFKQLISEQDFQNKKLGNTTNITLDNKILSEIIAQNDFQDNLKISFGYNGKNINEYYDNFYNLDNKTIPITKNQFNEINLRFHENTNYDLISKVFDKTFYNYFNFKIIKEKIWLPNQLDSNYTSLDEEDKNIISVKNLSEILYLSTENINKNDIIDVIEENTNNGYTLLCSDNLLEHLKKLNSDTNSKFKFTNSNIFYDTLILNKNIIYLKNIKVDNLVFFKPEELFLLFMPNNNLLIGEDFSNDNLIIKLHLSLSRFLPLYNNSIKLIELEII